MNDWLNLWATDIELYNKLKKSPWFGIRSGDMLERGPHLAKVEYVGDVTASSNGILHSILNIEAQNGAKVKIWTNECCWTHSDNTSLTNHRWHGWHPKGYAEQHKKWWKKFAALVTIVGIPVYAVVNFAISGATGSVEVVENINSPVTQSGVWTVEAQGTNSQVLTVDSDSNAVFAGSITTQDTKNCKQTEIRGNGELEVKPIENCHKAK